MKDLKWTDECALGIPAIDLQHKRIFDCLLRVAHGAADDDRLRAEAEIIKLLNLLQEHFSLEESMMQKLRYPDLEHHIEEHRQFHSDVHHLAQTSLMRKAGVSREAIKVAHAWLTEHIMIGDKHYFDFFSNPIQHKSRDKKNVAKWSTFRRASR
jgi:hemerythrin-like metal-binding protein